LSRLLSRRRLLSLGAPRMNLDKALSLAAAEEEAEVTRKLLARK
jgi:hypothetical protein